MFIDYYKILGVDKQATEKDIKSAYRKLARKYHPDLHPDDKNAKNNFQEINEANNVLSDPVKRKKYDQYGNDGQQTGSQKNGYQYQEQSSTTGQQHYSSEQNNGDFSDFFESLFGASRSNNMGRQARYKGKDYNTELYLDLLEASHTHKQTILVNGNALRITIPAGIVDGQVIKINGHGEPGTNGKPNGDLFIKFFITNNSKFQRKGNELNFSIDISFYIAVLGGEITIDTLDGKVKLKVKPETQNGDTVKLKGKGFPVYKSKEQHGDLYITYSVKIPTNLTVKQKDLFSQLASIS